MKRILLAGSLYIFCLNVLFAQSDAEAKIKLEMWNNAPPEFKATQVPDKWKNESAVILATKKEYIGDFATKMTNIASVSKFYVEKVNYHLRIKLLDKAAIKEFSEISFNNKQLTTNIFGRASTYSFIAIKVIKPSGSEKEVDLTKAVETDASSNKDKKIPIPNLETGDIIDYFIAMKDESLEKPSFGDEDILEDKYPIVKNTLSFKIPHQYYFYSNSYNGAPQFKKEVKDNDFIFTLTDDMREKAPDLLWEYEYRTSPHIRYTINHELGKSDMKIKAEKVITSEFSYNSYNIGYIEDFMKANFKKEKDPQIIVNEVFYLLRNPIYRKAYFSSDQSEPLKSKTMPESFFKLLSRYMLKCKITHEVMLVPARRFGPFGELVDLNSCDILLKINASKTIYIPRPSPFSIPNEIPYYFDGVQGTSVAFGKDAEISDNKLPLSLSENNSTNFEILASLDPDDNTKMKINRSVNAKGNNKLYHQYLVCTNYDYLKEYDLPKYQAQSSHHLRGLIKEYNNEKVKLEQRLTQDYNDRDIRIKKEIENDWHVKIAEYKNLSLKSIGMWDHSPNTIYSDEFVIENLTKKAGPNIIIEVGKLIEEQTEVKDDARKRTRDVHMEFPRSYNHKIALEIPHGYSVEGIENLNKKVENVYGGFTSSAKIEGGKLVINVKKYYLKNYCPAKDWEKMMAFLDEAVNFYNAKILLKKG